MIAITLSPDLGGELVELVGAVFMCVASIWLIPWLRRRALKAKTEDMRAAYLAAIDKLDAAIGPAVAATEQTVARKLRVTEPEPGKLSTSQAEQALSHAVEGVLSHFGDQQLDEIAGALGRTREDLVKVIRTRVEAGVHKLRAHAAQPTIDVDATVHSGG